MTSLVVSDLDGTLAFDGRPPVAAITALLHDLANAPDTRLVLATSRSPRSVRTWFGTLADRIDLLCCNGALVLSAGVEQERHPIGPELLEAMVTELRRAGEDHCLDYGDHFVASSTDALPWMGSTHRTVDGRDRMPSLDGVLKLSIAHADPWAPRLHALAGDRAQVFAHLSGDADIVAAGVTKATALQRLINSQDIPPFITAFGNDSNDLDLLQAADRAFVVGPGLPGLDRLAHVDRVKAHEFLIARTLRLVLEGSAVAVRA